MSERINLQQDSKPFNLCIERLARDINVSVQHIEEIARGERSITAELALRLARYFDMSPQFWLGLQMDYDLDVMSDVLAERLPREVKAYTVIG